MKKSLKHYFMFAFICLAIGSFFACQNSAEKLYYAMETQGEIYGYDEVSISHIEDNGKPLIRLKENQFSSEKPKNLPKALATPGKLPSG